MASKKNASIQAPPLEMIPDWRLLLGHEKVLAQWQNLFNKGSFPQVVLLVGRAGIGKKSLLAALAAFDHCISSSACGHCPNCVWLRQGRFPEVFWLEKESERILIEDVALLQEHLSLKDASGKGARTAVIVDAEKLNVPAANRLLKTLEEPPSGSRIFLSTSRVDHLLPTVLSRCVIWRIAPPNPSAILPWLKAKLSSSHPGLVENPAQLSSLLKRAGHSPGLALELASQMSLGLEETIHQLLTSSSEEYGLNAAAKVNDAIKSAKTMSLGVALDLLEMQLNEYYRKRLSENQPIDPRIIRERRESLRVARKLVFGAKISLNTLSLAESVALSAFKIN